MTKYKTVKGFRDIYNTEYKIGKYIKDIIIEISEAYNYKPIELSEFEYTCLFTDFYGNTIKDSLYAIDNRYSTSISLRNNVVLSMIRSILENKLYVDKSLPIKLMSDTKTYKFNKRNRKQKAMDEKFVFVNANNDSIYLDIENINLALDVFYALGMQEVDLLIYRNNLDDKEFNELTTTLEEFDIFYEVNENQDNDLYDKLRYDFYYNGIQVASGGRHNNLSKKLSAPSIPSSSVSFDIDELKNIIEFSSLVPQMEEELDFLVMSIDNNHKNSLKVASRLRELGVKVDINYNEYDQNRIRDFIDRMNIPYTILINEKDIVNGIVTVRNSISKEEGNVYFESFIEELIEQTKHHHD